jgi:hypothetical protein
MAISKIRLKARNEDEEKNEVTIGSLSRQVSVTREWA